MINIKIVDNCDKKKDTIYVVMLDICKSDIEKNIIEGKICFTIKKEINQIIISPGFSKTYLKDDYCRLICKEKNSCQMEHWNESCFKSIEEYENYTEYSKPHITRHNTVWHYADGANKNKYIGCIREERTPICEISQYEYIGGYLISPVVLMRSICKDYKKATPKNLIGLNPILYTSYAVYVFLNPKECTAIYDDIQKYKLDIVCYKYSDFDIVIAIQTLHGINNDTAISGFSNVYVSTHPNKGIGDFVPFY